MLEEIEKIRFGFEKQKEFYKKNSSNYNLEGKYKLIEEGSKDIWSYFSLVTEILFDLASEEDRYLLILKSIFEKIKNDLASGPFFDILIRLGKEKPEIAIKIYEKIQKDIPDNDLKIVSGLILGAYSIKDEEILKKLLETDLNYPLTNTILKAILIKYENSKELPKKIYDYLEKVSKTEHQEILNELINIYLALYKINKNYFYEKIKKVANRKISPINARIFLRAEQLKFSKKQIFELIEISKDCNENTLDNIMYSLINRPKDYKKSGKLFIYWMNKVVDTKIRNFDWALGELVKLKPELIDFFLKNFKKINNYQYVFPNLFGDLAKINPPYAIKSLLDFKLDKGGIKEKLFFEMSRKIIGCIYLDKKYQEYFLPLAEKIHTIASKKKFILTNKKYLQKNYDSLIDYIYSVLEQLQFRKRGYDFEEIKKSIKEFPLLEKIVYNKILKFEKENIYSPLLWLNVNNKNEFTKKLYLQEFENYLKEAQNLENQRLKNISLPILKSLSDENRFWDQASEIFFINKFIEKKDFDLILEPKVPNKEDKRTDLKIKLNDKKIYFEVVSPKLNRNVELDNGAVFVKNKVRSLIDKKYTQIYSEETLNEIKEGKRKDLFFIVIDASSSGMVDEYQILDALHGSLAVQILTDKKTGKFIEDRIIREKDSIYDKNKNTSILSGIIYFKRQLVDLGGKIKFILVGNIIINPNAINQPTKEEIEELKKIIFSSN